MGGLVREIGGQHRRQLGDGGQALPVLEQQVINRESRASGYQARKAKRKVTWKEGERAKKRQQTAATATTTATDTTTATTATATDKDEDEEWDEDALDALFNETVRYAVVNAYPMEQNREAAERT